MNHFDDADRAFLKSQQRIAVLEYFYNRVLRDIREMKAWYPDNGALQYDLCRAEALLERERGNLARVDRQPLAAHGDLPRQPTGPSERSRR